MASGSMISCVIGRQLVVERKRQPAPSARQLGECSLARSRHRGRRRASNRLVSTPDPEVVARVPAPSGSARHRLEQALALLGAPRQRAHRVERPGRRHDAAVGTRPQLGRMPVTPQKAAGMRTEPAVSVPSAASTKPAATAAPLPPLEPPQMWSGFHGLSAGPKCGLVVEAPYANSCVLSFRRSSRPLPATAQRTRRPPWGTR